MYSENGLIDDEVEKDLVTKNSENHKKDMEGMGISSETKSEKERQPDQEWKVGRLRPGPKKESLKHKTKKCDIACIQETWFRPTNRDGSQYNFNLGKGYEVVRKDREGDSDYGGVMIVVRANIDFKTMNFQKYAGVEIVGIELQISDEKLGIINIYIKNQTYMFLEKNGERF